MTSESDPSAAPEAPDTGASGGSDPDASGGLASSGLAAQIAERRAAADRWREAGVDPYPASPQVSHRLGELVAAWDGRLEPGEESGEEVAVGGRVVARRGFGKLAFLALRDGDDEVQVLCQLARLGEDAMARIDDLDVGDWVVAAGEVVRSRRGELSVQPGTVTLAGKSLRPLPDKWHGLRDTDTRFRQREMDLVVNAEARRVFRVRSATIGALRAELADRGYVEVETPILHPIPGGATARPFVTHHNALDIDLYLRVAPELYLKRLVAGGMTRVYEINRSFRNEGLSPRHNPEFTMLESYEAFSDYVGMMELTQALIQRAAREAVGSEVVTFGGRDVDLSGEWPRLTVMDAVRDATGEADLDLDWPVAELRAVAGRHGIHAEDAWGPGKIVDELRDILVERDLWNPTFLTDYPVEVSPLARRHREDPRVTERFELIVTGREWANAFTELTDPDDQRARFEAQATAKAAGDEEAMGVDEAYLRAMELGMPPMGGLGVGIDRLVMALADVQTIRDVILFPTLRPE